MERLFKKGKNTLNINLTKYIMRSLSISDLLKIIKVNQRMYQTLKKSRTFQILVRLVESFDGLSYMEMLSNNSNKIETSIANEMNFQKKGYFDLEDWKELKELVIYVLSLKLIKEKKIEFVSMVDRKSLFYLRESLLTPNMKPKNLSIQNARITKYTSTIISSILICGKIMELDLTKCNFTKIAFKTLLNVFGDHKYHHENPLRKLILKRCELGDKRIFEILKVIQNKKNLYYLDLTNNKIREEPFFILSAFPKNFYISNLKLDFNEISKCGAKWLSKYLHNNHNIKKISMISCLLNERSFNFISSSMVDLHEGINKFTIGLNTLLDPTVKFFFDCLKLNTSLKCIKIFFWEFTQEGFSIFNEFLAQPYCGLTKLYFCSVPIGDKIEIFSYLIASLVKNSSITKIVFSQCDLDNKHVLLIDNLLANNSSICQLDLRNNFFSEENKQVFKLRVESSVKSLKIFL